MRVWKLDVLALLDTVQNFLVCIRSIADGLIVAADLLLKVDDLLLFLLLEVLHNLKVGLLVGFRALRKPYCFESDQILVVKACGHRRTVVTDRVSLWLRPNVANRNERVEPAPRLAQPWQHMVNIAVILLIVRVLGVIAASGAASLSYHGWHRIIHQLFI